MISRRPVTVDEAEFALETYPGRIIKGKDLTEPCDEAAVEAATEDKDCPDCEVWQGTRKVAAVKKAA